MLLAFNKPFGVLSRFTPDGSPNRTLAEFGFPKGAYPIGRLDADSEGLLLLSDEAELNESLLHPGRGHDRTYWVQVEHIPSAEALKALKQGVKIQDYRTLPCSVRVLDPQPAVARREPPIRVRKTVPDIWLELTLREGKNRQVRRMTAAVGHPTLRLIRVAIGGLRMEHLGISPGKWRKLSQEERVSVFANARFSKGGLRCE